MARSWRVIRPGPIDTRPLRMVQEARPTPGDGEVLVRVLACGVCRTDLHVCEGDLDVHRPSVVPGHEVVGEVVDGGARFAVGDRIGIAWLRGTCGRCEYCRRGAENLCASSVYTGWDADGGNADSAT
ncbi:MAG: alcohol dehydrogenase catalytic domain-containing protein, partial [Kutzneria sp.]|nr:alcohol dehydrogenase catalytic domain-containing protein [Kutzneria sp.]